MCCFVYVYNLVSLSILNKIIQTHSMEAAGYKQIAKLGSGSFG